MVAKEFLVKNPYGYEDEMTTNELWQWFLYNQPDEWKWFDFLDKIRVDGELALTNGALVRHLFSKKDTSNLKVCRHEKKYINVLSNTLKFWVCPECGKDLGDAK